MPKPKRVGVVADDITGSNDIGIMLAKGGLRSGVFSLSIQPTLAEMAGLDAVILNTDSRLDTPSLAAQKTLEACALLQALPCDVYHSKVCSVFRGNIGAQFDAMQTAIGAKCTMVVAGFPKNGRTTVHGIHSVYGVPLAQTMFRNDPTHPTTESDLTRVMGSQTSRPVRLFDVTMLDLPLEERRAALADLKETCAYVLFDVRDQADLVTIAELIAEEKSLAGSSAICEELPHFWPTPQSANESDAIAITGCAGSLIVSGSLTEPTKRQVAHLIAQGVFHQALPAHQLLDPTLRARLETSATQALTHALLRGESALLYAEQDPVQVALAMQTGAAQGMAQTEVARTVCKSLATIAKDAAKLADARKVIVAGGETSAAVSDALGIRKMIILQEIEPGVPAMLGYDAQGTSRLLVFKSGSFGSDTFLSQSDALLRTLSK